MSKWKSAEEIKGYLKDLEGKERLFDLYGTSSFCNYALLPSDFEPDIRWKDVVELSNDGADLLDTLHKAGISYEANIEKFILFQWFYHRELLIDFNRTDRNLVIMLLNNMHENRGVKWPYVFGTLLYNKFNKGTGTKVIKQLEPDEVEEFLKRTPQGIFQEGKLISGPLGFVDGNENRIISPTLELLLWHCSDPGCKAAHMVTLRKHKSKLQQARDSIVDFIIDTMGPPSEWDRPIRLISRHGKWPNGRPYTDLPAVIGDCIIGQERTRLLARCIRSNYNSMLLFHVPNGKKINKSPEEIADSLTAEEQHQLLLMLSDEDLVSFIDELIIKRDIVIPPSELRTPKTYSPGLPKDVGTCLSSLGIRSLSHPPVVELAASIWSTYESLSLLDELQWRLRNHKAPTVRHSVINYIRARGPAQTIKELILVSPSISREISKSIIFRFYDDENEEETINRFLWKFGFNMPRYNLEYELLRTHLLVFEKLLSELGPDILETDKEKVRAIGVNVFVAAEVFLEDLLCYNVWLLNSDHFTGTRFQYKKAAAHEAVISVLGSEVRSGTEKYRWSFTGANNLGTMLAYLNNYCAWLKGLDKADKTILARKEEDFPHYAKDTVWIFPFKHTALWADSDPGVLTEYHNAFKKVCHHLALADPAKIRNSLDHKRPKDEFPTVGQMVACARELRTALDITDDECLIPKLFWGYRWDTFNDGTTIDIMHDYRGNSISLVDPSVCLAMGKRRFGIPYLIVKFDFLNQPNSMLFFTVRAESNYGTYWEYYPKRRFIPPREQNISLGVDSKAPE